MTDLEVAKVESSFIEYQAGFNEPVYSLLHAPEALIDPMLKALRGWGLTLDNIANRMYQENLGRAEIEFTLLSGRSVLRVNLRGLYAWLNNPSWSEQERMSQLITAAVDAILLGVEAKIQNQLITLGMHIRPALRSPTDIAAAFLRLEPPNRLGKLAGYGLSIYGDQGSWLIDRSTIYPGSLFLRMQQTHPPERTVGEIAKSLADDETALLQMLGLRVD